MAISTYESPFFSVPDQRTAIEARVEAINAAGGVNGRPIEALFCNDKFDPNEGAACARRAVEEDVVAAGFGSAVISAASILPILSEAGIPWIGSLGLSGDVELTDPISYPFTGGQLGYQLGLAKLVVDAGATNVAVIANDSPAGETVADNTMRGLEAVGATGTVTKTPAGTVDFSGVVAQALSEDIDGVISVVQPGDFPKTLAAIRQLGFEGPVGTAAFVVPQQVLDELGDLATGVYASLEAMSASNTDVPAVQQFLDETKGKDPDCACGQAEMEAWMAVDAFARVAAAADDVTSQSIRGYLDTLPDGPIDMKGIYPDYGSQQAPADYPRAVNWFYLGSQVEDGTLKVTSDFQSPPG